MGEGDGTGGARSGDDAARSVLVVEDDPSISDMLLAPLNAEGYRAELAADGGRALDTALGPVR